MPREGDSTPKYEGEKWIERSGMRDCCRRSSTGTSAARIGGDPVEFRSKREDLRSNWRSTVVTAEEGWRGRRRLLGIDFYCCTDTEGAEMWNIAEIEAVAGTADLSNSVDVGSRADEAERQSMMQERGHLCDR